MDLPFIHKNFIILSLLRTVTLNFTMYILTILTNSLKIYVTGELTFNKSDLFEFHFQ